MQLAYFSWTAAKHDAEYFGARARLFIEAAKLQPQDSRYAAQAVEYARLAFHAARVYYGDNVDNY